MRFFRKPAPPTADNSIRFEGDFPTYAAALKACGGDEGHESIAATDRYVRRFQEINQDIAATVAKSGIQLIPFMAAFSMSEPIDGIYEVFDFGGGYGPLYDQFQYLYPDRKIRWTIVEVPKLVVRAAEMGQSDCKRFETEIPERQYSLGVISGALQYMPDPAATWDAILRVTVPLIMIGRVPIVPSQARDRLTVQRVPASIFEASFPAWFFSPAWQHAFEAFGETIMQWDSPKDQMSLDGESFCMQAFLLRRRSGSNPK